MNSFRRSVVCTLLAVLTFWVSNAHAAVIKQLVPDANVAVVEIVEGQVFTVGSTFLASHDGRQCRIEVQKIDSRIAQVDLSKCPFKESLRIGQELEVALFEQMTERVVASTEPVAEERPPRSLFDLSVLPTARQLYLTTGFYSSEVSTVIKAAGSPLTDGNSKARNIELELRYGFTDRLSIGLFNSFLLERENFTTYGPASTKDGQFEKLVSDGLGDPTIGFGYRVLESPVAPYFNADLTLGYLAKTQDSKIGNTTTKGNNGRGGDGFLLKAHLSSRRIGTAFGAFIEMKKYNKQITSSPSGESETTGGDTTTLGVQGQIEPNQSIAFLGEFLLQTSQAYTTKLSGTIVNGDTFSATSIRVWLKYTILQQRAIGYLNYESVPSFSQSATVGTTRVRADIGTASRLGFGVTLLF